MKPYLSDEQIHNRVDEYTLPYRTEITRVTKEFRDLYEAHRKELMDLLVEAQGTLKERRAPHNLGWCVVKGECICGADAINAPIDALLARIEHHTNPTT